MAPILILNKRLQTEKWDIRRENTGEKLRH